MHKLTFLLSKTVLTKEYDFVHKGCFSLRKMCCLNILEFVKTTVFQCMFTIKPSQSLFGWFWIYKFGFIIKRASSFVPVFVSCGLAEDLQRDYIQSLKKNKNFFLTSISFHVTWIVICSVEVAKPQKSSSWFPDTVSSFWWTLAALASHI